MCTIPHIDCHHHLWRPSRYSYLWLQPDAERPTAVFPDLTPIAGDYWIGDYLADVRAAGVVKSVHLDSGYVPEDPVGETRLLQSLADEYGFPHGIVARARSNGRISRRRWKHSASFRSISFTGVYMTFIRRLTA
ncbi:hypothetical protein [Sodalis glossinidius]|uniref:hypothetical protein n=1 Tax=Sodalis glossinidius TaxID=63612 RepID=UPI00141282C2|nr:hypothetical protein [Sodalis glossinidius]